MTNTTVLRKFCLVVTLSSGIVFAGEEWTWQYNSYFSSAEKDLAEKKRMIYIEQKDVPDFSQVVISWNAQRPSIGYFSFEVRVRSKKTGQWGEWHHMADWGSIQKSYYDQGDGISQAHHVRLELLKTRYADGFAVKITPRNGASLALIDGCFVSVSNYHFFKHEQSGVYDSHKSIMIKKVPKFSQFLVQHPENSRICSPTSCAMLVNFLHENVVSPDSFSTQVYDEGLETYGSWPFNTAHAYELAGKNYFFYVTRLPSFQKIYDYLQKGIPVVVSVRGSIDGAPQPYPHGHLMVIVGWNKHSQTVVCHDPAAKKEKQVLQRYPIQSFLQAWERSYRLAYIAEKK